jgi:hypothetical protein
MSMKIIVATLAASLAIGAVSMPAFAHHKRLVIEANGGNGGSGNSGNNSGNGGPGGSINFNGNPVPHTGKITANGGNGGNNNSGTGSGNGGAGGTINF